MILHDTDASRRDVLAMIEPKTACTRCGVTFLQRTAEQTGGLCMPCYKYVPEPDPNDKSDEALRQWIKSGRTITAIKLYREVHSCGIGEAKNAVEALIEEILAEG